MPDTKPKKERRALSPQHQQAQADKFTKNLIVGAVVAGWILCILIECYISIISGAPSATVSDVVKQGLAALVGFLAKTGMDNYNAPIGGAGNPVEVKAPDDEPLKTQDVNEASADEPKDEGQASEPMVKSTLMPAGRTETNGGEPVNFTVTGISTNAPNVPPDVPVAPSGEIIHDSE